MDKQTALLVMSILGAYVVRVNGHEMLMASKEAQKILDTLGISHPSDISDLDIDEKIERALHFGHIESFPYGGMSDQDIKDLLFSSRNWSMIIDEESSPALDLDTALEVSNSLCLNSYHDHISVVLTDLENGWELWVKTGPEQPVYSSLKARSPKNAQLTLGQPGATLHAIIMVDCVTEQVAYDFGMPSIEKGVWHSFYHGDVGPPDKEIIWSLPMPEQEEIRRETSKNK